MCDQKWTSNRFNVYIDDLISRLESDRLGCCVNGTYVGCIVYADDILLMSASVASLQSMLIFVTIMAVSCLTPKKSVCIKIGRKWSSAIDCMKLNNVDIKWVTNFKYLGVTFEAGQSLQVDCSCVKRKFYAACEYASEFVKLHLVKS